MKLTEGNQSSTGVLLLTIRNLLVERNRADVENMVTTYKASVRAALIKVQRPVILLYFHLCALAS